MFGVMSRDPKKIAEIIWQAIGAVKYNIEYSQSFKDSLHEMAKILESSKVYKMVYVRADEKELKMTFYSLSDGCEWAICQMNYRQVPYDHKMEVLKVRKAFSEPTL